MADKFVAPEQRVCVSLAKGEHTTVLMRLVLPCAANGRRLCQTAMLSLTATEALAWAAELTRAAQALNTGDEV